MMEPAQQNTINILKLFWMNRKIAAQKMANRKTNIFQFAVLPKAPKCSHSVFFLLFQQPWAGREN